MKTNVKFKTIIMRKKGGNRFPAKIGESVDYLS